MAYRFLQDPHHSLVSHDFLKYVLVSRVKEYLYRWVQIIATSKHQSKNASTDITADKQRVLLQGIKG